VRKQLCDALVARSSRQAMVFLTGDLGFMALEPLQAAMGQRFINAGVAEQNMVSVAAAMAREGLEPWVYSIAPFCYARPFEQIRNDAAFHNLPIRLIGNGGGYGYGVQGPTHHAVEDYGVLLTLPNLRALVPAFDEDVAEVVTRAGDLAAPVYLRLGRGEPPAGYAPPPYAAWRQLTEGGGGVVIAVGPLVGTYLAPFLSLPEETRPNLWTACELPLAANPPPPALVAQVARSRRLLVVEEHVARGGAGAELALMALAQRWPVEDFRHLCASGRIPSTYGSQAFMRALSGLDPAAVLQAATSERPGAPG
jgi:transketolase